VTGKNREAKGEGVMVCLQGEFTVTPSRKYLATAEVTDAPPGIFH